MRSSQLHLFVLADPRMARGRFFAAVVVAEFGIGFNAGVSPAIQNFSTDLVGFFHG